MSHAVVGNLKKNLPFPSFLSCNYILIIVRVYLSSISRFFSSLFHFSVHNELICHYPRKRYVCREWSCWGRFNQNKKVPKIDFAANLMDKVNKVSFSFSHFSIGLSDRVWENFYCLIANRRKKTLIIQLRNLVGRLKQLTTLSPLCNPLYLLL